MRKLFVNRGHFYNYARLQQRLNSLSPLEYRAKAA
ncbi:IS3 family transposase [Peribacillus asahii]